MISKITEIDPKNGNIKKIIVFDKNVGFDDLMKIYNEFDYDRTKIEKSARIYRDVGLVLELKKSDENLSAEWKEFLKQTFPKRDTPSKLDNVFVSKDYNKLLLITNRRLMMVDLKKVNEKINDINYHITVHNEEWLEQHPQKEEKKGFFNRIFG